MQVVRVQESKRGNSYIIKTLKDKKTIVSRAIIMFSPGGKSLKLGRYYKDSGKLVSNSPKSELTLDDDELKNLVKHLADNYRLVLRNPGSYIKTDDALDEELLRKLKFIFTSKKRDDVINFLSNNPFLPSDIENLLEIKRRQKAVEEFRAKLNTNETEYEWQKWFSENDWVLGNDYAEILEERQINTRNIDDFLVRDFDGFVDLIEIKRPEGGLSFWASQRDHGNLVPHSDLIKAITQVQVYLYELEKELDSITTQQRLSGASIIKPRATLIFGRSYDWSDDERNAYRILNASYSNISILTYDHVSRRAQKLIMKKEKQ